MAALSQATRTLEERWPPNIKKAPKQKAPDRQIPKEADTGLHSQLKQRLFEYAHNAGGSEKEELLEFISRASPKQIEDWYSVANAQRPNTTDPALQEIPQGLVEKKHNGEFGTKPSELTPKPDDTGIHWQLKQRLIKIAQNTNDSEKDKFLEFLYCASNQEIDEWVNQYADAKGMLPPEKEGGNINMQDLVSSDDGPSQSSKKPAVNKKPVGSRKLTVQDLAYSDGPSQSQNRGKPARGAGPRDANGNTVGNAKWPDITDPAVRQILQGDINDPAIQQTMRRYAEKKLNVESGMKPSEPTPKPDDKKNTLQDASRKESVLKAAVPRDEQRATTQYAEDAWYAEDACYYETHFNNRNLEIEVLKELALTELEGQSLELQSRSVEVKNLKTLLCEMRGRMHRLLGSCLREELAGHQVQVERLSGHDIR